MSLLAKNVSKNYKVAISSDGGDELLYGYSRHKFYFLFYFYSTLPILIKNIVKKIFNFINFSKILKIIKIPSKEIKLNKIKSFLEADNNYESYMNLLKIVTEDTTSKILKNYKKKTFTKLENKKYSFENIVKEIDYNYYLPMINFKNDRCGMQHSLEIREPLLNFEIVRSFYDHKFKFIDFFYSKRLFRSILKNNGVKVKLKKTGFSLSQADLLSYDNFILLENITRNSSVLSHFFNYDFLQIMINEFKVNRLYSSELWLILNFSIWFDQKSN